MHCKNNKKTKLTVLHCYRLPVSTNIFISVPHLRLRHQGKNITKQTSSSGYLIELRTKRENKQKTKKNPAHLSVKGLRFSTHCLTHINTVCFLLLSVPGWRKHSLASLPLQGKISYFLILLN